VHKAFAGREQDWLDIEGIVARQTASLDRVLILAEVAPLLELQDASGDLDRLRTTLG
jgi:hypothetical protein